MNGDGRPDLFVAGYTDVNGAIPGSAEGFPTNHRAVRDLLYLNLGPDENGRSRFREVGREAGPRAGTASTTGSARSSPTSTTTAASISTSRTTRTRTGST